MTTLYDICTDVVHHTIQIEDMPPLVVKPTVEVTIPTLLDRVTEAIEAVVAEAGPGHVYHHPQVDGFSGRYVKNGQPDCLIGRVLHRIGVSIDALHHYEGYGPMMIVTRLFPSDPDVSVVGFGLNKAQFVNDTRLPWRMALNAYHEAINH